MSTAPVRRPRTLNGHERVPAAAAPAPLADLQRVLPETMFVRAVTLERKRAERSRKLFVLMLVQPRVSLAKGDARAEAVERTAGPILSAVRETDVVGWYKERNTLGVVFAELGTADKKAVLKALDAKVTATLQSALSPAEVERVRVSFHCFPDEWDQDDPRRPLGEVYPDLAQRESAQTVFHAAKRAIDILGSAMLLLLLAPVLLAVAVAVKLSSPGPILFRQRRIGRYGVPFTFLKFRSMHAVNDSGIHRDYVRRFIAGDVNGNDKGGDHPEGAPVFKLTDDPRVTRVGRLLRKTSLDELPQLFNVLAGDMSLVGPRPPIPYELEVYDVWHRRRLFEVKPGVTGLWQVSGRSKIRFDDMVRLDLRYARACSLWLDLKILLQTPAAVFSGKGAY